MARPRVVAVAQPFKETLGAQEVAAAMAEGVRAAGAEPLVLVASDGGDGLLDALAPALARRVDYAAVDPRGRPIRADVGWLDRRSAVIESRLVIGLGLLDPAERNPSHTTTRGVGDLVRVAAADGADTVYVGLGGSATMDGGVGMARAWGWRARDADGAELPEGGGALERLARLEPGRAPPVSLIGLSDVRNRLVGPRGARVFAPQKGATRAMTAQLDRGLRRLARVAGAAGPGDLAAQPGAGAAGGLGFGILYFAAGRLVPGAPWVLDRIGFDEGLVGARLVMVGEGAFDRTSLEGKLSGEVLQRAARAGVPALLVAPRVGDLPAGVLVESGNGQWSAAELGARCCRAVGRALRLLGE